MGGFGGLFLLWHSSNEFTSSEKALTLITILSNQSRSLLGLQARGHSYEDMGMQERAKQNKDNGCFYKKNRGIKSRKKVKEITLLEQKIGVKRVIFTGPRKWYFCVLRLFCIVMFVYISTHFTYE